jgi:lysophospholipase L1-like esterase
MPRTIKSSYRDFRENAMTRLYGVLLVVLSFASSQCLAATAVMPLGDSATLGAYNANDFGIGGYRAPLWSRLIQEGYSVDFVGSVNGPAPLGVDPNHEGHGGWRIDDLTGSIDGWLATSQPKIILLMAGGNDIIQGYGVNTAISRMDTLLARIFADRPSAVVLLAELWWVPTPNFYNYDINQIQGVNSRLPTLVKKYRQQGRTIELVDQYNIGWVAADFGTDQIHPNANGYAKMAQAWHNQLASHLGSIASVSPDGTIISGSGSVVTIDGVWTFGQAYGSSNWYILLNGNSASGAIAGKLEVSNGGKLYALGTDGNWYVWTGAGWTFGSPSGNGNGNGSVSPDGTVISGGSGSLTTSQGTWTFGSSVGFGEWYVLLNTSSAGGGAGSKLEVSNGGHLYVLGTDGNWYLWTGSGWTLGSPSDITGPVSPDGTATSGGVGTLTTTTGTWTFGSFEGGVNWDLLLNGNSVGIGSELKVSHGGQMYGIGTDSTWYVWNGSWSHGSP